AVDADGSVGVRLHECLEALAAWVLLDVALERLHRAVDDGPGVGGDARHRGGRVRDVGRCGHHQSFCPQTRWPTMIATANAVRMTLRARKKKVAGPASSVV